MISDHIFEQLKKALPDVKKKEPLRLHTTFKIGGPAEYFLLAKTEKEIMDAIAICRKIKMPIFVMGGGSNLLVSDKGVRGLVVKNQVTVPIKLKKGAVVEAPAGATFGDVVSFSIKKSLEGLEWAGGLPGTFGGAIRGNAGAFGGEMKDSILSVRALDHALSLKKISDKQSAFSYRSSVFKQKNWVVLSGQVKLKKGDKKKIREIAESHIAYRKERHPLEYPNAGSVFKNVAVEDIPKEFQYEFMDKIKQDPFPIVPSAWLIIGAGLTGKKIGKAQISKKHSNYIVNLGNAKAADVARLIELVKEKVKIRYHVTLEPEVQMLGF